MSLFSFLIPFALQALRFSSIFVLGTATGCCFFVLGAGIGVGRLPLLIVFLSNLLIEASLFAFSFQNLTLSFTRACAAKVFNVGNILLGSGGLVGC